MVDGCCDTEKACCTPGTGLKGYKVYYDDGGTPVEINNGSTLNTTIAIDTQWDIYLELILDDVVVTSIVVTPTITGLIIASTPYTATYPGTGPIVSANWSTTGTRLFTVDVTTDSGNYSFTVQIKVI